MTIFIGSGMIPIIHWWIISPIDEINQFLFGPILMFSFYLFGFIFFHFHIPERWFSYKFDFIGNSHQIWHLCILIAALSWWFALDNLAQWRVNHTC